MEYSVNQINNLLRTYPQQLKARVAPSEGEVRLARDTQSVDRVRISPEGKRLLEEATVPRGT